MTMIDDRGRIASRFNIVDVAAAVIVLVLIPAAYGSYLLFRNPPPKLTGISPNRLYPGNQLKVEITGRDLRPFMRVSFNNVQGGSFSISSPSLALVDLPDLAPGVYDIVLYDYAREVDRLKQAFTIMPRPPGQIVDLEVEGVFVGIADAWAGDLKPHVKLPDSGDGAEILSVGAPSPGGLELRFGSATVKVPTHEHQLPATLRVRCAVHETQDGTLECLSLGTMSPLPIKPDAALTMQASRGWVRYQVQAVHAPSAAPVLTVRVRFVGAPELLGRIRTGDADSGRFASATSRHAVVASVAPPRAAGPNQSADVVLRIPVDLHGAEWIYKNDPVKVGAPLSFETAQYVVSGEIIDVSQSAVAAEKP
jgi:hypothetical protein